MTSVRGDPASASVSGNQELASYVGIAHAVREAGCTMVTVFPDEVGEGLVDRILRAQPRGFIGIGQVTKSAAGILFLERLRSAGMPVAILGDDVEGDALSFLSVDSVCTDQRKGARSLVAHLHSLGRTGIAFQELPGPRADACPRWYLERRGGYVGACEELGLTPRCLPSPPSPNGRTPAERFRNAVRLHVEVLGGAVAGAEPADAIMLLSDGGYHAAAAACRELGRQPGSDILIAGYDHYWAHAEDRCFEGGAPAATVDKRNDRVGGALVRMVLARARGEAPQPVQRAMIAPELVVTEWPLADAAVAGANTRPSRGGRRRS
jgi:DNA-binding LacI/PurR family transcriptional regulator